MRPKISEFSYGYAVTSEICTLFRHVMIGAPRFPSLLQEGQIGYGYDVMVNTNGYPFFLQFKLSHKMKSSSVIEIYKHHIPINPPFFRMYLMPTSKSRQHPSLLDLDQSPNRVYYVAPFFHTQNELDVEYSNNNVLKRSYFIRPRDIGSLPDGKEHHIALKDSATFGYLLSEPRESTKILSYETFIHQLKVGLAEESAKINEHLERIFSKIIIVLKNNEIGMKEIESITEWSKKDLLSTVYYVIRLYFGCELIFLTGKE